MGILKDAFDKKQERENLAAQLVRYTKDNAQELASQFDGSNSYSLQLGYSINSSEIYGDPIDGDELEKIIGMLDHDSDGAYIDTLSGQFIIKHQFGNIVFFHDLIGGSSQTSEDYDDSDDEDDDDAYEAEQKRRAEQRRQNREQQNAAKKEEENKARDMVKEIDDLPISTEDIVLQIKECSSRARRDTFSSKLANQMVKDAWLAREQKLRDYADAHCAENAQYVKLLAEERAKKDELEQKEKEQKAKRAAKQAEEKQLKKERQDKEAKEEAHFKKVNRICWLSWLGLTVFFLSMGDPFDYEWWHYVLISLASIVSAIVLFLRWMSH